ncbi:MAG TPA: BadF/BadG/BcrA/BcrD ATPase family protein [Ktedonobacterales bacterium]|nr:BadF/BadG/BcrA/BcrD ATPase family protein [Ktedonobacterales bacterium]
MSGDTDTVPPDCFYLGVDGGGSKTLAIVVDAHGNEHGRAVAGSANYSAVGLERAVAHVLAAAEEAARAAGTCLPLAAAWLGLAGVDRPADHTILLPHLSSLANAVHLTNDAELLLSALPGQAGVVLIAGTGSIAVGRSSRGATTRAGGWGHILGDEGSGYDIGRRALVAATRFADGRGEPTLLLPRILRAWHLTEANELISHVYYDEDKAAIARLAPLVLQAAREDDHAARRIVRRAAIELALAAVTVGNRLAYRAAPLPIALGGSLLLQDAGFRADVLRAISRHHLLGDIAVVEQPAFSAAQAAIALAAP